MALDVKVVNKVETIETNEQINNWYQKENERREELKTANKVMLGLLSGQMILYLIEFLKNLEDRDDEIDDIIDFNDYLHEKKHGVDLDMVREKVGVMNLALPEVYHCEDVTRHIECTDADARAIDSMSEKFSRESSNGVPNGWSLYEGKLMGARATSDSGGLIVNASKREQEWMRKQKTDLMRAAQQNIKSPFRASEIMNGYAQAMNIYSGLADLYAQGFNSAGAGIGVLLGRMTATPVSGTNVGNTATRGE